MFSDLENANAWGPFLLPTFDLLTFSNYRLGDYYRWPKASHEHVLLNGQTILQIVPRLVALLPLDFFVKPGTRHE